jgi:diacylglycerol kinase family enzyme
LVCLLTPSPPAPRAITLTRAAYQLAAVHALIAWGWRRACAPWQCRVDSAAPLTLRAPVLVAVGNGRYWGGGLCICPGAASPHDGALAVTLFGGVGLWDFVFKGARRGGGQSGF